MLLTGGDRGHGLGVLGEADGAQDRVLKRDARKFVVERDDVPAAASHLLKFVCQGRNCSVHWVGEIMDIATDAALLATAGRSLAYGSGGLASAAVAAAISGIHSAGSCQSP